LNNAAGASAALRNVVKKIAARFRLPIFHTQYPSDDVDFVLGLAVDKVRADVGLEDREAEKLRIRNTDLRQDCERLRHEKRLSDQSAAQHFAEAEKLKAENRELRIIVRTLGGTPPTASL
jgi:hypothetical protein